MFSTLKILTKLKFAYLVNGILHFLKTIPIIKNILPEFIYNDSALKNIVIVIAGIFKTLKIFVYKWLYISFLIVAPLTALNNFNKETFLIVIFFLSLAGAITNTKLFNPTMDKYYAIMIMKMDAKRYLTTDYTHYLLTFFIGMCVTIFTTGIITFGFGIDIIVASFIIPIYIISVKNIYNIIRIKRYERKKCNVSENELLKHEWILSVLFVILPFVLIYFNISIAVLPIVIIMCMLIVTNIYTLKKIYTYKDYRYLYKEMFSSKYSLLTIKKGSKQEITKDMYSKTIQIDESQKSSKTGYKYFNDIFVQRHRKILMKNSKIVSLVLIGLGIVLVLLCTTSEQVKPIINEGLLYLVPSLLIIMYFINPGIRITQAMFMNCDYSMLTYNFYREPKAMLELFKERLKSIILINLIPTIIIAIFAPIILFLSGGTQENINYVMLSTSVVGMSIFFSVHALVMYYIFQPFNKNMEMKSPVYMLISGIVYMISYMLFGERIPTIYFAPIVTIFCIIYILIGIILAYKLSPKTFKIK